ncbi:MAG: TetR/AcrR family transcriptional regulator [Acidobacteria bacterium]|nr:TetR/AcrR family transcriptional regulator [Acidobacteriota bacterium]
MTAPKPSPDRRVRRTRASLQEALASLLTEQDWDQINVQEICDRADVGRSTFYLHFQGKEQLLSESFGGLRRFLQDPARHPGGRIEGLPFLRRLLQHVLEQRKLFQAVIGRGSSQLVQARFRGMVAELTEEDLLRSAKPGWRREVTARFLAGAIVEALAWWVDARCEPRLEEVEGHLQQVCAAVKGAGRTGKM